MSHQIRRYKDEDLTAIISIWEKASQLAHSFLSEEFMDQERYNLSNVYILAADTWIAEVDSKVVGFISLIGNEVAGLFVNTFFHKLGIGYSLMNIAKKLHGDLVVEVFNENTIGRVFYERYGFTQKSRFLHKGSGQEMLRLTYTQLDK
ncbi:MAG: GNAT family N-acetyltransferase [Clostridiales bacterium]|nr:GNAT family N-acetyltransferase [Clostridiales bacterium]